MKIQILKRWTRKLKAKVSIMSTPQVQAKKQIRWWKFQAKAIPPPKQRTRKCLKKIKLLKRSLIKLYSIRCKITVSNVRTSCSRKRSALNCIEIWEDLILVNSRLWKSLASHCQQFIATKGSWVSSKAEKDITFCWQIQWFKQDGLDLQKLRMAKDKKSTQNDKIPNGSWLKPKSSRFMKSTPRYTKTKLLLCYPNISNARYRLGMFRGAWKISQENEIWSQFQKSKRKAPDQEIGFTKTIWILPPT